MQKKAENELLSFWQNKAMSFSSQVLLFFLSMNSLNNKKFQPWWTEQETSIETH